MPKNPRLTFVIRPSHRPRRGSLCNMNTALESALVAAKKGCAAIGILDA